MSFAESSPAPIFGIDGSISWIAARAATARFDGSVELRMTINILRRRALNGINASGSAVGLSGSPRYFISATTPIIVDHGSVESGPPALIRLPIGSSPGQNRRVRLSVTLGWHCVSKAQEASRRGFPNKKAVAQIVQHLLGYVAKSPRML